MTRRLTLFDDLAITFLLEKVLDMAEDAHVLVQHATDHGAWSFGGRPA